MIPSRARPATVVSYRRRQQLARATVSGVLALWERVDPARIRDSWQDLLGQAVPVLAAAQLTAVSQGVTDAHRMVLDAGGSPEPQAEINPQMLVGIASDGRSLPGLLLAPAMLARARLAAGVPVRVALRSGSAVLTRIVATQVTDAGRIATGIGLLADRQVTGYLRRIQPPACDRCLVQDGKKFATNTGFDRHPQCDCVHEPILAGDSPPAPDLQGLIGQMSGTELDAVFGPSAARRIRDGADPADLVDASSAMTIAGTASTDGRVTPEALYATSSSPAHAIRLLRRHGYLT